MNEYESWKIGNFTLEYFDDVHQYLVDGICVPSITQMLKYKFGKKYEGIDQETLKNASRLGTAVHEAIERMCKDGTEAELPEIRNFKFLQKQYDFEVLENEVPVILFADDEPISAGRLDMVIKMILKADNGNSTHEAWGLADIKRTSTLDKEYLSYQLNLYRIAYRQSYGVETEFLRGIHLRENVRKFVNIPIKEDMTWCFIHEYLKGDKQ
jgi:hypothetical protein